MKFTALNMDRIWEDRDGLGHKLEMRAKSFDGETRLKEVFEWFESDGGANGNLIIIPEKS